MQNIYETYYWQNDKVRLRAMRLEDDHAEDYHIENLDSEAWTMAHQEVVLPIVKKDLGAKSPDHAQNEKAPAFSIENLDGEYVGHIHFNYINERHGTFSVGLIIWRKYRSKGYGKAALKILLDYAFNERRMNKFNGFCLDDNESSKKLMVSLGCIEEGKVREEVYIKGKFHDRLLFGLTASEYKSQI